MTHGSSIRPPSHDHGCRHTASFVGVSAGVFVGRLREASSCSPEGRATSSCEKARKADIANINCGGQLALVQADVGEPCSLQSKS